MIVGLVHSLQLEAEPSHAVHPVLQLSHFFVFVFENFPFGQVVRQSVPSKNLPGWHSAHYVLVPRTQVKQFVIQLKHRLLTVSSEKPEGQLKMHYKL